MSFVPRRSRAKSSSRSPSKPCRFEPLELLEPRLLLDAIPLLHSNPGAPLALYLDFDGGTWGGTVYGAYDREGNPTDFNAQEVSEITKCWEDIVTMY